MHWDHKPQLGFKTGAVWSQKAGLAEDVLSTLTTVTSFRSLKALSQGTPNQRRLGNALEG